MDPTDVPARFTMAYLDNRDTYLEWRKQTWMAAASELFDDA